MDFTDANTFPSTGTNTATKLVLPQPPRPPPPPPSAPPPLVFHDLNFTAHPSLLSRLTGAGTASQRILTSVSALARRGELLFIMGPSGAGKTSCLDLIAGRVAGDASGHVLLHGRRATSSALQRALKYVPQVPSLYETLTVAETLRYAAAFYVRDAGERARRVEAAIAALGLHAVRDVRCGGAFYRGLSGGQLRRVAVAVELVARPAVLLLDEPTSGLDATGARRLVEHLRAVAAAGVAVVCTIHQPTQYILDCSHRLLLLSAGRVAYFGPTHAAPRYFAALGCKLPPRASVAEWLLDEVSTDFSPRPERVAMILDAWDESPQRAALEDEIQRAISYYQGANEQLRVDSEQQQQQQPQQQSAEVFGEDSLDFVPQQHHRQHGDDDRDNDNLQWVADPNSFAITQLDTDDTSDRLSDDAQTSTHPDNPLASDADLDPNADIKVSGSVYARGQLTQTWLLAQRNLLEAARNPAVIYLRLIMYLALALLIGAAWWRMDGSARRLNDRLSALFYTSAFMIFMSIAVLPVYLNEKVIVTRERSNAAYSAGAYVAGHFVMEVAFMAAMAVVLSPVVYYMAAFNAQSFERFVFFAINLFFSLLVAESIMMLIAAVVPFLLVGIAVGAFLFGLFMVVQGYLRPVSRITWILRWTQYVSLHTFSYNAFSINELTGRTFEAAPDNVPPILVDVIGDEYFAQLGLPMDNKWNCLAVMVGMLVVYRALGYFWIATRWNGKK